MSQEHIFPSVDTVTRLLAVLDPTMLRQKTGCVCESELMALRWTGVRLDSRLSQRTT